VQLKTSSFLFLLYSSTYYTVIVDFVSVDSLHVI